MSFSFLKNKRKKEFKRNELTSHLYTKATHLQYQELNKNEYLLLIQTGLRAYDNV